MNNLLNNVDYSNKKKDWIVDLTNFVIPLNVIDVISLSHKYNTHKKLSKTDVLTNIRDLKSSLYYAKIKADTKNIIRDNILSSAKSHKKRCLHLNS